MTKKLKKYLIPLLGLAALIVNLVAYSFLPEKVGMQINTGGELRNYIPKTFFVIIAPAVMVIMYMISKANNEEDSYKYLIVSIIVFAINITSIFFNL
jgi:hypothetical protein